MSWTFVPPTVQRRISLDHRDFLFSRVTYDEGVTVVKTLTGGYRQEQFHDTNKADIAVVYLGGHVYPVDDAEAAALTAAGYGANLTEDA
jgi:hypothetical protein